MATKKSTPKDRLTVTYGLNGPERFTIYWEQPQGEQGWKAFRLIPGRQFAPAPDFDADTMLEVFRWMRDILAGHVTEDVLAA